jgi:hypothetical protein
MVKCSQERLYCHIFSIACVDLLFFVPATFVSAAFGATTGFMSCDHSVEPHRRGCIGEIWMIYLDPKGYILYRGITCYRLITWRRDCHKGSETLYP